MKPLGIAALQPGVTAYDIVKPGNANYDESKANPYPTSSYVFSNGKPVDCSRLEEAPRSRSRPCSTRRLRKYPVHVPRHMIVARVDQTTIGDIPVIVKHIVGHTTTLSAITVDIHADVVTPASKREPGCRHYRWRFIPRRAGGFPTRPAGRPTPPPHVPDGLASPPILLTPHAATSQSWGFVIRNSASRKACSPGIIDLQQRRCPSIHDLRSCALLVTPHPRLPQLSDVQHQSA